MLSNVSLQDQPTYLDLELDYKLEAAIEDNVEALMELVNFDERTKE